MTLRLAWMCTYTVWRWGVPERVHVRYCVEVCLNVYKYGMVLRRTWTCACMVRRWGVLECIHVWYCVEAYLKVCMYGTTLRRAWMGTILTISVCVCLERNYVWVQPKSNLDVSKRPKDLWRLKPIMIYQLFIYIVVMSRETKQYTNTRVCRKAICSILNNLAER